MTGTVAFLFLYPAFDFLERDRSIAGALHRDTVMLGTVGSVQRRGMYMAEEIGIGHVLADI